jgi:hypothetical protein
MAEMTADELVKRMQQMLGNGSSSIAYDPKNFEKYLNDISEFSREIKKGTAGFRAFQSVITGQMQPLEDITGQLENFRKAIEKENEIMKKAIESGEEGIEYEESKMRKDKLLQAQGKMAMNALYKNIATTAVNLGALAFSTYMDLTKYAIQFSGAVLKMAEATEVYANAANKNAEKFIEVQGKVAEITASLGAFAITLSKVNKWFFLLGIGLEGVAAVTYLNQKAGELTLERNKVLDQQTNDLVKNYKDLTKAGATLGSGMTELYTQSIRYGIVPSKFAEGLMAAKEDLSNLGMTTSEAINKIAEFGQATRKAGTNNVFQQLYKLGYSYEEQVGLLTNTMAQMQSTGSLLRATQQDINRELLSYGKSLKLIEQITGKNAKEQMAQARLASMESAIRGRLNPKQLEAFQAQLSVLPEQLRKGYVEWLATKLETGTSFATDAATNVAMQFNHALQPAFDSMVNNTLQASMKSRDEYIKSAGELMERAGAGALAASKEYHSVFFANLMAPAKNAILDGATQINNALNEVGTRLSPGLSEKLKDSLDAAVNNMNMFDQRVADMNEIQRQKAIAETASLQELSTRLDAVLQTVRPLDDLNAAAATVTDTFNSLSDTILDKLGMGSRHSVRENVVNASELIGAGLGTFFGAGIGSTVGPAGTFGGGLAGGAGGAYLGKTIGTSLSNLLHLGTGLEDSAKRNNQPGAGLVAPIFGATNGRVGAGGVDPRINNALATIRANPKFSNIIVSGGHEFGHRPGSAHERGKAVDFTLPPELIPKNARESAALIAELKTTLGGNQFRLMKDEYTYPDAYTHGGHIHGEYHNGGDIPSGRRGIVGDGGVELVNGPMHVTSVDDTRALFKKMSDNIEKLVMMTKNDNRLNDILDELTSQTRSNQKILTAVS